jgi:hypothetical protein
MDGSIEMIGVMKGAVGEMVALEVAPGALNIGQLGRVLGQPLDGEPRPLGQGLAGELADVDGPLRSGPAQDVVEHQDHGAMWLAESGRVGLVQAGEQGKEVAGALGGAGLDQELVGSSVQHAWQGAPLGLARRLDAQIDPAPGPGMRQAGMGQGLGLVAEQEAVVAGPSLLPQERETQARPLDGVPVLPTLEGMSVSPPGKTPFRSGRDSHDSETVVSVRRAISLRSRGKVQTTSPGAARIACAQSSATLPLNRPGFAGGWFS